MSADCAPMFVDDRDCGPDADAWRDPHDIIPESFRERFADCASAREALREAEQAATTTDTDALPRCPSCDSIKIQHKPGMVRQSNQRDGDFTCNECGSHFDTPRESVNEAVGEQATLGEVTEE